MESNYYDGSEKRNYFRIVYKPNQRPILKVKHHEFEVSDISETGLRLLNDRNIQLGADWIRLTAILLDGEAIEMEGKIVWKKDDEFGLRLRTFIPTATIKREKQYSI
ncbi:MAG: PilZ domain-containing protein [Deltaproteobacteria bacterium]|nr:MAG: PilZ domain-containing protein [Deltaproteobacteria bacterium]